MKKMLVAINAKYSHQGPAVWMLQEACARHGLAVHVLETEISRTKEDIAREILRQKPDFLGFSCYVWNIELVEHICAIVRLALPACYIVWGGPEVSYDAPLRMLGKIAPDAILCGEGEQVLPAMLLRLERSQGIDGDGVVTRDHDGGIARGVPTKDWIHLYGAGVKAQEHRLHYVETARGCPFVCRYCLSAIQGQVRALPVDLALQRLLSTRDAGATTIKVLDRTFNFDPARARAIWKGLIQEGGDSIYHFEIAAHLLQKEDLDLLATAPPGLFQLEIGVQTTDQQTLAALDRKQEYVKIEQAIIALRRADNLHLHLDLIAGLPGEPFASFARSLDQTLSLRPNALQLGFLKILPGSLLKGDVCAMGLPFDPAPPYEIIVTDAMSFEELAILHDIEDTLSMYYNTTHFQRTKERYLTSFAQVFSIAQSLREEGFFSSPHSLEARFDALYRALPSEAEPCLRYDWLCTGQKNYRPFMKPAPENEMLRSLGLPVQIAKRSHVERFAQGCVLFRPEHLPTQLD